MILETPKEDDAGKAMDPVNLGILRGFFAALDPPALARIPSTRPRILRDPTKRKTS